MPESSQFSNVYILVSQTCRFMNNFKCSVTGFLNTLSIIGHDYINIEKKASRYWAYVCATQLLCFNKGVFICCLFKDTINSLGYVTM
jgi:hypothetical protein